MKHKKQKRATAAFKIRTAQSEQERHDIAYWGRVLTPLERWMDEWLANSEILKRLPDEESRAKLRATVTQAQSELQRRLLEAVKNLDAAGLRQLANHMEEMTPDYRAKPAIATEKRDVMRSQLLTLKEIYPDGLKLTSLAAMIGYTDELSSLDRIAKDVGFQLQIAPVGRPKKATSKQ